MSFEAPRELPDLFGAVRQPGACIQVAFAEALGRARKRVQPPQDEGVSAEPADRQEMLS